MYLRLLTALFALAALVLAVAPARADQTTPTGSIAIRGSLLSAPDQDPAAAPAADGFGSVSILTPDGRTLTLADASLHGANYVWDDDGLVFGSYYIDTAGIAAPAGYAFAGMSGGMEDNGGYLVDLTWEAPNAYVFVSFLADDAGGELERFRTDPLNSDTDGDGYGDGDEIDAGSDPRDAASIPVRNADSTLVVDVLLLPVDYDGNDYVGDSEGLEDIEVTVSIPASEWGVTRATDENGRVVFEGLGEGVYNVYLHVPGDAADFITVFGTETIPEPRQHENQNTNNPAVYVGPDETLFGTFFVIPEDAGAEPEPHREGPRPSKPQPVKALPNTGAGAEAEETDGSATLALILAGGLALAGSVAVAGSRKRLA